MFNNKIKEKKITLSKTGVPCLWEETISNKTLNAFIISDNRGGRIKPLFIKSEDNKRALLPIEIGYFIFEVDYDHSNNLVINIGKIVDIMSSKSVCFYKVISTIENNKWDNVIPEVNNVIMSIRKFIYDPHPKPIYIHNTSITMTSKKYIMTIDVESDGLFGTQFAVSMIVFDHNREIVDQMMVVIDNFKPTNNWVIENVNLNNLNGYVKHVNEYHELLRISQNFYNNYIKDSVILTDIPFPVDTSFIYQLTEGKMDKSPYPIIDLGSILIAKGFNFNINRLYLLKELYGAVSPIEGNQHDPYFDNLLTAYIYFKIMEM